MNELLAPWQPTRDDPFDLQKVGHLFRRAGFGTSLRHRQELVREGLDAALAAVDPPSASVPGADAMLGDVLAFGDRARVTAHRVWLALESAHPLREKVSIFWHGHFATSDAKVQDPRVMAGQLATFDRLGLLRFDELAQAMARDPALLVWLDNQLNKKGAPNENFARELFELFTLGRGAYTEQDIREAARAFSGWHVRDGQFFFARFLHDDGDKQVLGRRGALTGDDVVAAAVTQPASAPFLAAKWLRAFVHPEPTSAEIEAMAACYLANERHVGATLRTLLRSRLFFSPRAYRTKIKSPAEFAIGTVRLLGARAVAADLARAMATFGEAWLMPPTVEGWHGERAWLSGASWLLRSNWAAELFAGQRGKLQPTAASLLERFRGPEDKVKAALLLLLDGECSDESRARLLAFARSPAAQGAGGDAALLHATVGLPEYQLS
ncbi:MAG: DUF1800 domain-containing protein [Planctomycetes bacterium]|nr:DUF1800 domain-containing protein [Planctomycetota bacterium]